MKTQSIVLFIAIIIFFNTEALFTQQIRPIRDNIGYSWQADRFDNFINWLKENCLNENFNNENLIAGISPHDDYLYAGKVYYPLFKIIKTKEAVIFGVTHGTVRKEIGDPKGVLIFDEYNKWKGPYSDVEISPLRDVIKRKLDRKYFIVSNAAQSLEHSIEGLIPFLQYYNRDIKITSIMVTATTFERMNSISTQLSDIISDYMKKNKLELGKDIFFLFSSDANHYGEDFDNSPYGMDEAAHLIATENDKKIANESFNGIITTEKLVGLSERLWPEAGVNKNCPLWCGRYPIVFGLLTLNKIIIQSGKKITGKVFKYSDTWTGGVMPVKGTGMGITAPYSLHHWVGFFSAGFYLE